MYTAESNDRLYEAKERVRKLAERREAPDAEQEKNETERKAEARAEELENKIDRLTTEAEKALRDLIDYGDELTQQEQIMRDVTEKATVARVPTGSSRSRAMRRAAGRTRNNSDDEDEEFQDGDGMDVERAEDAPELQVDILSPTELLKKAKEEYTAAYTSKSMRARFVIS